MRVQNSFFQIYWDWKIVVPYLVVCSHNPFLSILIPSLGASLWLTAWMKSSAHAFREHPITSSCRTFTHTDQSYKPPNPSQRAELRASWSLQESFCQLCRGLAKAHGDSKGPTLCRSSSSDGDGVSPADACKRSCWGEAGDGGFIFLQLGKKLLQPNRNVYYFGGQSVKVLRAGKEHRGGVSQPRVKYRLLGP